MKGFFLISVFFVLFFCSCGGGSKKTQEFDYYKEAYVMGKKEGFTSSDQSLYEITREAASGWWTNYFRFQPPSTPEEKQNFQKFEQGWKDGVDEGHKLITK